MTKVGFESYHNSGKTYPPLSSIKEPIKFVAHGLFLGNRYLAELWLLLQAKEAEAHHFSVNAKAGTLLKRCT